MVVVAGGRAVIRLKPGVRLLGIRPEIALAINVVASVYQARGHDVVVTSVIDGVHSRGSEHYAGAAFDCRLNDLPEIDRGAIATDARIALGTDFDVLHEGAGTPGEHLHVEYDPKVPY